MSQQKRTRAYGPNAPTPTRRLAQPFHGRRFGLSFLNTNTTGNQKSIDLAPEGAKVRVTMERQAAHAGDPSVCARFLRVDDLYVIEWFPAHSSIGGSEDINCSHQINLADGWKSKEDDALGLGHTKV
jgi:hypothetical protein